FCAKSHNKDCGVTSKGNSESVMHVFASSRAVSWIGSAVGLIITFTPPSQVLADDFRGVGFLPGHNQSIGNPAVSGNGSVVVGTSSNATGGEYQAFYFSINSGTITGLGFLPGSFGSAALSTNTTGTVSVGRVGTNGFTNGSPDPLKAVIWTPSGGPVFIGGSNSVAEGVNASATGLSDAVVVGNSFGGVQIQAFRWTQANGMVSLGLLSDPGPGAPYSDATAVNADGTVVVGR